MDVLDEALDRLHLRGPEYLGGLANHGPMAAEALLRLGHPALLPAFLDVYLPRLPPREVGRPLAAGERTAALGRAERLADWAATFEADLADAPWQEVLAAAMPPLLPGLFAGATHGWLRVAHAVRALEASDSLPRRRELARGLAYWAGRFQRLPGRPGASAAPEWGAAAVLGGTEVVPGPLRRPGLFFESVKVLDGDATFESGIARATLPDDVADLDAFVSDVCAWGAAQYLANPAARIAYVHTVTAPSALRILAPHLVGGDVRRAAGTLLQSCAALHAVAASDAVPPAYHDDPEVQHAADDVAEIAYLAACSLEEHSIKFADACLTEDRARPDRTFRLAAADAALRISGGRGRGAC